MKLSIVICTYNNAESLAATLTSVGKLDLAANSMVEICLIDNNSTDDTAAICSQFIRNSQIPARYFFEPQQGLSHARNRGIREACGEYIVFTDDDVLVAKDWIRQYFVSLFELHADAAFGRIVPEWRGRKPAFYLSDLAAAYALLDYGSVQFFVKDASTEFFGANFAVRRSLLSELGGFDVRLGRTKGKYFIGEERQVYLALVARGAKIHYNPDNVVRHVIAESRKNKAFLRRYFTDVSTSMVFMDRKNAKRWWAGMPAFRWRQLAKYIIRLPFLTLWYGISGRFNRLFLLELQGRTLLRMIQLYRE